jgi:hypothetical protein
LECLAQYRIDFVVLVPTVVYSNSADNSNAPKTG